MKRSREPEEGPQREAELHSWDSQTKYDGALKDPNSGEGEDASPRAAKITELDLSDNDTHSEVAIHCSLPPHKTPVVFSSYSAYETHYRDQHTNRCAECRKNFPSAHLLGIHIEETHDSFVQAKRERGDRTYSCFVEGCDRKCSTPQKRKMHLIDKHMYPKNFFFAITREGIDGRRSLLQEGRGRRRKSNASAASRPPSSQGQGPQPPVREQPAAPTDASSTADPGRKTPEQQPDHDMEDLAGAMSALQFVPMSVRFGRGKKAGFAKR